MTFRTFTLKDVFDPAQAESQRRIAALRPLTTADLAAAGMRFVPLPEVGGPEPGEGERVVLPEGSQEEEQVRLAKEWAARQP